MGTERRGFTLVELLVALALTGLVVLVAHAVLAEVADAASRGRAVAGELDREGNRRTWLRRAFANVTVGSAPARGFEGRDYGGPTGLEADRVLLWTRLPAEDGDGERWVGLRLTGDSLVAEMRPPAGSGATPELVVLANGLASFGADYLIDYGAGSAWVREWISPVSAPVAVRLRLGYDTGKTDTLLLHVGPRG